ncbi:tetrapyrrole biosynthesis, uroporphyrinogen III synthase [Dactylonectria estremocensis]|uniref:Tetrapyrrole biosynthesis, uroporphyrinogen III synthase n=1 Tax=Dactylonectria estremocensis TaxID=1079267 RepID=A0A9P9F6J3_9HYPO|nr:tetrapyrrole biosynthesis, uroporphyrinogen III synthase [Dactylonectria estremocensis]
MASSSSPLSTIPVLLLKTRSNPGDSYEDLFSESQNNGVSFAPTFVPVLLHYFDDAGMTKVGGLLQDRCIGRGEHNEYGGMIFTSQRAVEAFVKLVKDRKRDAEAANDTDAADWPHLQDIPVYSVGPATTRALAAVPQNPPLQVFGSHTGNGAELASYILPHYAEWYQDRPAKPPLLFLVGETRRDIIPKTLTDPVLADSDRIPVTETVVYGTGVMESFPVDLAGVLEDTRQAAVRWIVVFSPTGCDNLLRGMGMLDLDTGKARPDARDGRTFVATIGPTTRDHLRTLSFEPDVCADAPTPSGVLKGIVEFMAKHQI